MTLRFGILSPDLWAMRSDLSQALQAEPVRLWPGSRASYDVVLGWRDRRGDRARRAATRAGRPFRGLAVGPLRSVRPEGEASLSFVVDGTEAEVVDGGRAGAALATLRALRLSYRNDGADRLPAELDGSTFDLVVVPDGPDGVAQASVLAAEITREGGRLAFMADGRARPEVARAAARAHAGAVTISDTNPWAVVERASSVAARPGDVALIARLIRSVDDGDASTIVASRFLTEPVYLDAWTRRPVPFETAADQLAWLRDRFHENDRPTVCVGISRWKADRVARFLDGPAGAPAFRSAPEAAASLAAASGGRVVAWETRMPQALATECQGRGVPLLRMEDGFLRSVGLGAAFLPGASAVLDGRGIYYDPRGPSDLEHLLNTAEFPTKLLRRAAALRHDVVGLRLSKYNVGTSGGMPELPRDRPIVLVPGQVEDDASVLLGSPAMPGNLALLRAARRDNPQSFLIFKPHPDVVAGLRKGGVEAGLARELADLVLTDVSMPAVLEHVDAVETMTSLTGFEALMRERRVVVHGRPFYAGWGLTADRDPPERRQRTLSLDELVAGALILYPSYLDPVSGRRCPPEVLVRRLAEARDAAEAGVPGAASARMAYVRLRHALLTPLGRALRRRRGADRTAAPSARTRDGQ